MTSEVLLEETEWFLSFNMDPAQIGVQLGLKPVSIYQAARRAGNRTVMDGFRGFSNSRPKAYQ